jgi:hypothetical protein
MRCEIDAGEEAYRRAAPPWSEGKQSMDAQDSVMLRLASRSAYKGGRDASGRWFSIGRSRLARLVVTRTFHRTGFAGAAHVISSPARDELFSYEKKPRWTLGLQAHPKPTIRVSFLAQRKKQATSAGRTCFIKNKNYIRVSCPRHTKQNTLE